MRGGDSAFLPAPIRVSGALLDIGSFPGPISKEFYHAKFQHPMKYLVFKGLAAAAPGTGGTEYFLTLPPVSAMNGVVIFHVLRKTMQLGSRATAIRTY